MTLNQIKMVLQIAAAYGEPLDKDRIKEIIPTIAGALVCRGIARKVAGFVPALGWLVKGGMGYLARSRSAKRRLPISSRAVVSLVLLACSRRQAMQLPMLR